MLAAISVNGQEWKNYTPDNSPIKNAEDIKDIVVDDANNDVWMAAGLTVYQQKQNGDWVVYEVGTAPGLSSSSCIAAHNGKVWAGPRFAQISSLSHFNGQVWQSVTIPGATFSYVLDIEVNEQFVWVATDRGLFQNDGLTWKQINYQGKISQPTSLSWENTTMRLWVANNCAPAGNVFKYDPSQNSWTEYDLGMSRCAHAVQALPNGNALIGSCNYSSLLSVKNGQTSPDILSSCISLDGVALNPFNEKEAWFGTDLNFGNQANLPSGLVLFDGDAVIQSLNSTNSAMKGGGIEALAVQKVDNTSAVIWIKSYQNVAGTGTTYFLESYTYSDTYSAPGNSLISFQFTEPPITGNINGNNIIVRGPLNMDRSALKAIFTASDGSVVKVGDVVQMSGVSINDFRTPVIYTVVSSNGASRNYQVSVSISENSFLMFQIQEPEVVGDITIDEISVDLLRGIDLSSLVAEFTVSEGAIVKVNDIVQQSGVTVNDFRSPVHYAVVSAYGQTKNYTASVSLITSIEDENRDAGVQIFPIPAGDHVTVQISDRFQEGRPLTLTLYSVLGEVIETFKSERDEKNVILNTGHLKGGLVILKINDRNFKIALTSR